MTLYEQIKQAYPNIDIKKFIDGTIVLQNDSDGKGDYIKVWNYEKPLPNNLVVGKNNE